MSSLLKLMNKKAKEFLSVKKIALLSTLLFLSLGTQAEESNSQDWQIHGFLAQGLVNVNGSDFVNDSGDWSAELTEVGLNASYQLSDSLRLTGQAVYLDGGNRYVKGARVDYALIDWSVYNDENWLVNLYLGRFKNNHWLYSSTRDIPHTRPSIILPQSMYFDGFRDIAMGSDGGATKISYSSENYGDFDFNFSYGTSDLSSDSVKLLIGDTAKGSGKQEFDVQSSFYWRPLFSSWQFGLSTLNSDFSYEASENDVFLPGRPIFDATFSFEQVSVSALYEGEFWEFSLEAFQQDFGIEGFYFPTFKDANVGQGAYFQTRYKIDDNLTLMVRVERFYGDKDDRDGSELEALGIPGYFGFQHDVTVGGHYQFSDSLRIQMEYHWVDGTARLTPVVTPNVVLNNNQHWNMFAVQLMYWF